LLVQHVQHLWSGVDDKARHVAAVDGFKYNFNSQGCKGLSIKAYVLLESIQVFI